MKFSLPPEVEKYITGQVNSGHFPTPESVIVAAIAELRTARSDELDPATLAAIHEAEAQTDRGEGVDLDTFRAHVSQRATRNR